MPTNSASSTRSERRRGESLRWTSSLLVLTAILALAIVPRPATSSLPDSYERARQQIEEITRRPFKRPVPLESQSRREFQTFLEESLKRSFQPGELKQLRRIYYLLGFLGADFNFRRQLLELYRQQTGAYYDPRQGTIRLLQGNLPDQALHFLYLHELVHAYQDQHFDLGTKHEKVLVDSSVDRKLAFTFTMEGHANLVAMAALFGREELNDSFFASNRYRRAFSMMAMITEIDPARLKNLESLLGSAGGENPYLSGLRQLTQIPRILIQQAMDPYFLGQKLWFERGRQAGWSSAKEWLRSPPRSTRELLYGTRVTAQPGPVDHRGDVPEYSSRLGTYLLLRWMNVLTDRPGWGAHLGRDRAYLMADGNDEYLHWVLPFDEAAAPGAFLATLRPQLASDPGDPEGIRRFTPSPHSRYLRVETRGNTVHLWLDDDPVVP